MASDTPVIYAGPAQHTYTRSCDGFHDPGPCPVPAEPVTVTGFTWAPDA